MFSNLLFLIVALLIATFAPLGGYSQPEMWSGLLIYIAAVMLIMLIWQLLSYRREPAAMATYVQLSVLAAIIVAAFGFGTNQLVTTIPYFGVWTTLHVSWVLFLYWGGVASICMMARRWSKPSMLFKRPQGADNALIQLRLTMPFAVPFLLFSLLGDVVNQLTTGHTDAATNFFVLLASVLFLAATIVFFPLLLTTVWGCRPIEPGPLHDRLETICQKAQFRVGGLLTWPNLGSTLTAAIIGVVPRFRYVIFTPSLLEKLSQDAVEAVLVHEIGHYLRRHLLIYPFIFAGAMLPLAITSDIFPNETAWVAFALYAGVIILYVRFVFGFFSRLFERQADLTCFDLGVPAEEMIEALDEVGYLSGNIHDCPNWHHYSIRQRMTFLQQACEQPMLITQHHTRVRRAIITYFVVMACGAIVYYWFL